MTGEAGRRRPVVLCDCPLLRAVEVIPGARRAIRDAAVRVTGSAQLADDVELMACELLTNAVQHGSGEKMHVRVTSDGRVLRVEVRDAGCGPRMPTADTELLGERGRGLLLVAALSSRWGLGHDGEGTTAWFEATSSAGGSVDSPDVRERP